MENGSWFTQTYNAENSLSVVTKLASGNCSAPEKFAAQWNFSYDGDGTRAVQSYTAYDLNGNPGTPVFTEYFMGGLYEMSGSQVKKYYSMAGMTIAMNDGSGANGSTYLTDQLGSVVAITDNTGTLISQQRYLPFGQVRTDVSSSQFTRDRFRLHRPAQFGRARQRPARLNGLQCPHVRSFARQVHSAGYHHLRSIKPADMEQVCIRFK